MELLTFKVTPLSNFMTPPKGDTLFGQIVAYAYLNGVQYNGIDIFDDYLTTEPRLIVSDMMPMGYVYRPTLPYGCFEPMNKKVLKKKKHTTIRALQEGRLRACKKIVCQHELANVKNSISRMSFTTDGDSFSPYGVVENAFFGPLWLFMRVDSTIKEHVVKIIEEIGQYGFGKEGNLGKGRFDIELVPFEIDTIQTDYYVSLSPTLLDDPSILQSWYEPMTRFGKYGLHHAHDHAFKRPVLMAESGAVVKLSKHKDYFGNRIDNGVKGKPSFLQGYSIALPITIKDGSCLGID